MFRQKFVEAFVITLVALVSINTLLAQELKIPEEAKYKVTGVRIDDLVSVYPSLVPGLANVVANIKKNPQAFFPKGSIEVIHLVYLRELPQLNQGHMQLKLTAYVKYKGNSSFENIMVSYESGMKSLAEMVITEEGSLNLKDASFSLKVGLVERKLIVTDEKNDIKFIFPIGVGGFDEGVLNEGRVSLLTPRFKNGFIDQRSVISVRTKPRYFDGKPFIRLLKGKDLVSDSTAIGFHTEINDSFVRGFDSHGCMRLRVPDLMALHDLIMDGDELQTPITVSYQTRDISDHPAAKRNMSYKTVLNNGSKESPFFPLDRDNLVQMTYKESEVPLMKLIDDELDNYEDIVSYDTQLQVREQNERRKLECQAKLMGGRIGTSSKDFESCLDEGKRKDTVKDRLYRKFMGIADSLESELSLF